MFLTEVFASGIPIDGTADGEGNGVTYPGAGVPAHPDYQLKMPH